MHSRVGIIGGGISGLSAALRLAERGAEVTVVESSHTAGGLGTFFEHDRCRIDRFYHCIMPSDAHLLQLINDLGMGNRLYWKPTRMGLVFENEHYPFNTAMDLIRFAPLTLGERLRLGCVSLLLPYLGRESELDATPIREWLSRLYGSALWERFWGPLFTAKFGSEAGSLPSLYLSKRLGRERNVAIRGYLHGGLAGLIDELCRAIHELGGKILLDARVERIAWREPSVQVETEDGSSLEFDAAVSTVPLDVLTRVGSTLEGIDSLPSLRYQGVVNMLILLNRPLDGLYWTPVLHSDTEFDGVVETSTLVEPAHYGGGHAVYLMKYCGRDSELFVSPHDQIADRWQAQFLSLYRSRGLSRADIAHHFVFKAPYVEPIYPLGYSRDIPPHRLSDTNVYLATTAQVYPEITSWNSSVRLAAECVASVSCSG